MRPVIVVACPLRFSCSTVFNILRPSQHPQHLFTFLDFATPISKQLSTQISD